MANLTLAFLFAFTWIFCAKFFLVSEAYQLSATSLGQHEKYLASRRSQLDNARNFRISRYWPNARIPYVISPLYTENERSIIYAAMNEYHTKTCIRFYPRSSETDYLYITPDDGKGQQVSTYCYSDVGRMGGLQYFKMYGECVRLPAMIHEFGHAIGMEHEHNRADRDNYIQIIWGNINPTYHYAYNLVSSVEYTTLGLPYDYYSVMHYPDYSFAYAGKKAFTTKLAGYRPVTTENLVLSAMDVQKIKTFYKCN